MREVVPRRWTLVFPLALASIAAGCSPGGSMTVETFSCSPPCPAELQCTREGCVPGAGSDSLAVPPDLAMDGTTECAPACGGPAPYCQGGACVPCITDSHCPHGMVCRAVGAASACVSGCSDDGRCGAEAPRCCGGTCTDVLSDPVNCGVCGVTCSAPHAMAVCAGGACGAGTCDVPWADCNGHAGDGCETNLLADAMHCGACGTRCSLANATLGCGPSGCYIGACLFGWGDCNAEVDDGCETSTLKDIRHCGGCGVTCAAAPHATVECTNGACRLAACENLFADCDGSAGNGCEVNVGTDRGNCGACGILCGQGLVCVNGGCTCPNCNIPNSRSACVNLQCTWVSCLAGFGDCDGNKQNGCEVGFSSDARNCGACGRSCANNQSCSGGQCTDAALSFDFEENGGNVVFDGSPLHNDGMLAGGFARVAGYSGMGVHFDGTAAITVPDAVSLNPQAITLEVWVKFDRCTVNQQGIQDVMGKDLWDGNGGRQYLLNQQQAGFFRAHALVNGVFNYIDGNTPCVLGAWTHLAETYDGTTLILYVNGKLDVQKVLGGPLQSTNTPLTLGDQASGSYRVNGTIDSVRIFPYARSAQEIASDAK